MDKIINSTCPCGSYISSQKDNIIMLPCEHIIHLECVKSIRLCKCPVCKNKVKKIFTYKEVQYIWRKTKNKKYYQRYIDMASIKHIWDTGDLDPFRMVLNMPSLALNTTKLLSTDNFKKIPEMIEDIISTANINIKIIGKEKFKKIPKIIICNHSAEIDPLIIGYVFRCGFLGSSVVKDSWYGKKLSEIAPIIIVERGKKGQTVERIKEFISKEKRSICIFPEGFITHPKTIARFRTGAFNTGYPVQPIVIKYNPTINDSNPMFLLAKLFSQKKINITIEVLDVEYPPFSKEKIEEIRNKMGKVGNMALSRVSNRDIIDKN